MNSNRQVLVDSDAFVGWLYETDAHHDTAVATFTRIKRERLTPVTSSLVVVETATVLSHRKGQMLANIFLDMVKRFPVVHINEQLQREALTIFREQKARGTSVVDCSNVALMRRLHISRIFSFDKVYLKRFGFQTV